MRDVTPSLRLGSSADLSRALADAHAVALTAYTLRPGAVLDGLIAAADRGAAVSVRLERDPLGDGVAATNAETVAELRRHGARAALTNEGDPVLHLKAATVTDRSGATTAYLDDRNWPGAGDLVAIDTDPQDVAVVTDAIAGRDASDARLRTRKDGALQLEASVIRNTRGPLDIETESFGGSAVSKALRERAQAGDEVRLVVNARDLAEADAAGRKERRILENLAKAGVHVRVGDADEKIAVARGRGWLGSANASGDARNAQGRPLPQADWGLRITDAQSLRTLGARFDANWRVARPLS